MSLKIIKPLPVIPVYHKFRDLKTGHLYALANNQSALDGTVIMATIVLGGSVAILMDRGTVLVNPERFSYRAVEAELHIKE